MESPKKSTEICTVITVVLGNKRYRRPNLIAGGQIMEWRQPLFVAGLVLSFFVHDIIESVHNDIDKKHSHGDQYSSIQYDLRPVVMSTVGNIGA